MVTPWRSIKGVEPDTLQGASPVLNGGDEGSDGVKVPIPSIARFGRLAYPGQGEVTNGERLGRRSHGCHIACAMSVGATGVASKPAGLNISE
jgi:hypothetical protein